MYMLFVEEIFLVIIFVKINGIILWVYFDIGFGRNFILEEVIKKF